MNFLAHLHLSYPHKTEMVGNFIGDYVKGKQYTHYPDAIAKGIILHRKIDSFTDQHMLQRKCKTLFRADYGLYSGIIVDMLFDHLLAKKWNSYCKIDLPAFSDIFYEVISNHFEDIPTRVRYFLPKMKAANRLISYAKVEGIKESIQIMTQYTSLPNKTDRAIEVFKENSDLIEKSFDVFYHELIDYVNDTRLSL